MDFILLSNAGAINVATPKEPYIPHEMTLTISKSYHRYMYGIVMLQLSCGGCPSTKVEMQQLLHDYPLSASA